MTYSKAIGKYLGGAGETVSNTASTISLTADQEDTGWSTVAGAPQQTEWGRVLAIGCASFQLKAGTDDPEIKFYLEIDRYGDADWQLVPGGVDYAGYANNTGVDECTCSFMTLLEGEGGANYRLRAVTTESGDESTVMTDSVSLTLVQLPESWSCAAWTDIGTRTITVGSWADMKWNQEIFRDPSYYQSLASAYPMQDLEILQTGRYLVFCHVAGHTESSPIPGLSEGCNLQHRMNNQTGTLAGGMSRRISMHKASPEGSFVMLQRALVYDAAANDTLFTEHRGLNPGDVGDVHETVPGESIFAIIRVDEATPGMDWFRITRSSDVTPANGTLEVDYDTQDEVDAEFTHSTITNAERVTFPQKKVITFANINFADTTASNEHVGHHVQFRKDGTTLMQEGKAGSGMNYVANGADPDQNQSDLMVAMVVDNTGAGASPYYEIQFQEIGTAAHASTAIGGTTPQRSGWFGFVLDDAPDDSTPDEVLVLPAKAQVSAVRRPIRKFSNLVVSGTQSDNEIFLQNWKDSTGIVQIRLSNTDVTQGFVYIMGRPLDNVQQVILAGPINISGGTQDFAEFDVPLMPRMRLLLQNGASTSGTTELTAWLAE